MFRNRPFEFSHLVNVAEIMRAWKNQSCILLLFLENDIVPILYHTFVSETATCFLTTHLTHFILECRMYSQQLVHTTPPWWHLALATIHIGILLASGIFSLVSTFCLTKLFITERCILTLSVDPFDRSVVFRFMLYLTCSLCCP